MTTAASLAEYVSALSTTPASTHIAARRVLLDTIGAAVAGSTTRSGKAAYEAARISWGRGCSPVWFSNAQLTEPGAAFVNSAYASALDLDDGHRLASGHPAAAIIPAVLATAVRLGVSGLSVLSAIAIGYEVAVRIAAARDINSLRTVDTGRWCGYGVAAAVGWLNGASAETIANAVAIAGHTASSQTATGHTKIGHAVKEGIPIATATGITSFHLAASGYTGPIDILDDHARFSGRNFLTSFGEGWEIEKGYFKLYSACRWAHAPVDGVTALRDAHDFHPSEIEKIEIGLFSRALSLTNKPNPQNIEEAQYSIQFCVALSLIEGVEALLPVTSLHLYNPHVVALAEKVRLVHDSDLDHAFPAATPARVSVFLQNGRQFAMRVPIPKGEPATPVTDEELVSKFHRLAGIQLGSRTCDQICEMILDSRSELPLGELNSALRSAT